MTVNTDKTEIMVFKNGGMTEGQEKCTFKSESLGVVKNYTYLGFQFQKKELTQYM